MASLFIYDLVYQENCPPPLPGPKCKKCVAGPGIFSFCLPLSYILVNFSTPSKLKAKWWVGGRIQEHLAQRSTAVQVQATGPVCSRLLPVCQHRSMRYPRRTRTSVVNQIVPAASAEVGYVLLMRMQAENMNHNKLLILFAKQIEDYYHIGFRCLIICFK